MFKTGDEVIPVSLGGTSFKDAKLDAKNNAVIVSPSLQSYLFEFFFQVLIWGALFFITSIVLNDKSGDAVNVIITLSIVCLTFSAIVRFIFYRIRKIHNFDKDLGFYYSGKKLDTNSGVKLSEIELLHLISKDIYSSGKSYTSFELSFCTLDGLRVMVMNHGDRHKIKMDAEILSNFLDVPCEYLRKGAIYGKES
jgi:hypothetical protein